MTTRILFYFHLLPHLITATVDLNFAELEYLSDHLLPEECRRLVAAAHFTSYNEPNFLDQAERAIPKDLPCLQLLLHWNSATGEGKGETHEVLEHRLRQMGKYELANWLGKTVFHQLGQDLEDSLKRGLRDYSNDTLAQNLDSNETMPTIQPPIEIIDPTEWTRADSICVVLVLFVVVAIVGLTCVIIFQSATQKYQTRSSKYDDYEMIELKSDSGSEEDKFDVRKHDVSF